VISLNIKGPGPTPDVSGLEGDELKEAIKEWFFVNYEDPAENTPYETREGGYQYIWGGPYDAAEEISGNFNVGEEVIEEVVQELSSIAWEWAPNSNRIYDEDPPSDELTSYEEIQARLDELERVMSLIEPHSSLIGHNQPPDAIGLPPYGEEEKKEIKKAIEALRRPEAELSEKPEETLKAAEVFKTRGEKIKEFFARHGDKFVENFSAQLGKRAADSLTVALWIKLSAALYAVYESTRFFLQVIGSLPSPF
jgi:hypothetical protein